MIFRVVFILISCFSFSQEYIGKASYYGHGDGFHGKRTASGQIFDKNKLTCAFNRVKFGRKVKVVNLANGKEVVCEVNDTGNFFKKYGRIIDLSYATFKKIGNPRLGILKVKVIVL